MKPVAKIEFQGVHKRFGMTLANSDLNLSISAGTIHGIIGENGAGKSTAMKILAGLYRPDTGRILLDGKPQVWRSPLEAQAHAIGMVHQHFLLAGPFDAVDNVIIGRQPRSTLALFQSLDRRKIRQDLEELAHKSGFDLDFKKPVQELPLGMQQRLEILKLLYFDCRVLILDEPTAVLTPQEVDRFLDQLRSLRAQGKTILLITHKLREVLKVADAVSVFRAGTCLATVPTAASNIESLSEMMVGKKLIRNQRKTKHKSKTLVRIRGLQSKGRMGPLDFDLNEGQILGIAGVDGNGQKELFERLTQMLPSLAGMDASEIAFLPEDRLRDALVPDFSLSDHFQLGPRGRQLEPKILEDYDVRPPDPKLSLDSLSGGNQQKFVVARELSRQPKILIAYHPTRGVDLGAVYHIHDKIRQLADQGSAILLVSTELDELFELSGELKVLYRGQFVASFGPSEWTEAKVGLAMAGGK